MTTIRPHSLSAAAPPELTEATMLNALPHPVVTVDADGMILGGNDAAEHFFQASVAFMRRHKLSYFIPFGSPLLELSPLAAYGMYGGDVPAASIITAIGRVSGRGRRVDARPRRGGRSR